MIDPLFVDDERVGEGVVMTAVLPNAVRVRRAVQIVEVEVIEGDIVVVDVAFFIISGSSRIGIPTGDLKQRPCSIGPARRESCGAFQRPSDRHLYPANPFR